MHPVKEHETTLPGSQERSTRQGNTPHVVAPLTPIRYREWPVAGRLHNIFLTVYPQVIADTSRLSAMRLFRRLHQYFSDKPTLLPKPRGSIA